MVIEQAVILAAGRGSRLGELTVNTAKPMLEVAGAPLIDHITSAIAATGVRTIVVVTGYMAPVIENHLAAHSPIPVSFIRQVHQDGTAGALRLAQRALGQEPFLLSWGDIATASSHFGDVVDAWRPELAATVGVNLVADVSRLSAVVFGDAGTISAMVEKPAGKPPSLWNSSGLMVLGPQVWDHLKTIELSDRGELELPDAVGSLISGGETLVAVPLHGPWFDIGTVASLEAARIAFG